MPEQLGKLINTLKSQHESGADVATLLSTINAIRNELVPVAALEKKGDKAGVSVIMPVLTYVKIAEAAKAAETPAAVVQKKTEEKLVFELDPEVSEDMVADVPATVPLHDFRSLDHWPEQKEPVIPAVKEVNQVLQEGKPSLHEKLESLPVRDLGSSLQKEPIKDLKKGISINERYQFINHLFKGDETSYERSVKTINSFNIYSEAEFWIRRELAMKLGWKDDDEVVQHFHQLVNRRFL